MLKDTWSGIIEQMHELGLTAVVRLFKINYNLRCIDTSFLINKPFFQCVLFNKRRFYNSPNVRYHPTSHTNIKVLRGTTAALASPSPSPPLSGGAAAAAGSAATAAAATGPSAKDKGAGKDNLEHLSIVFNLLVSIIDHMIRYLVNLRIGIP